MTDIAILGTALLFGGTALYSFGFAAFIFSALPAEQAGPIIRKAFPHFYLFVFVTAALSGAASAPADAVSGVILGAVALTTLVARQGLMPAINAATDAAKKQRFRVLHTLSVLITLTHIAAAGYVLVRLAGIA